MAVAVIAILAALAMPSYLSTALSGTKSRPRCGWRRTSRRRRSRCRGPLSQAFPLSTMPRQGYAPADKIVNNYVKAVAVKDGAIQVRIRQQCERRRQRQGMPTLRPAVVEDAPIVPVEWVLR